MSFLYISCAVDLEVTCPGSLFRYDPFWGSPGVEGPIFEVPPSPDYIPGPEGPPSPDYIPGPEGPPSPDYVPGPEEPEQAPPSPLSPYSSPLPQIPSPPLPIPPPPPISPTYVEGSLGSRAVEIRQRNALPVHETEIPEMWLPLRKRLCRTTPGLGYEVGESSAAGTARRQFGPTTAEADLYGFTDMLEAAPGCRMSRKLGYGICWEL
ncbi:hypothetical protein Tco_0230560 [Tanacetum coccineum]